MLERTTLKPKLNFRSKLRKGLRSRAPIIDVTDKKDSLLVYVLKFFRIWRVGVVVFRVRGLGLVRVAIFFLFNRNSLNNRSNIFEVSLKNGSDRLRKGQLRCRHLHSLASVFKH